MSDEFELPSRKISHEEWLRLLNRFPRGKHPWHDIYDEKTSEMIGRILSLEDKNDLTRLRRHLCMSVEVIETFTLSFGGVSSKTEKKIWIKSSIAQSSALIATMNDANIYAPEPYTPSAFDVSEILDLQKRRETFRTYLQSIDDSTLDPRPTTMHADYLQFVVDRMTEVFLQFRPASNIRRSSDSAGVYGVFPDFIRAATKPYLMKSYPKYRANPARYEKLDRQIQHAQKDAVSRARRHEQNVSHK